MGRAADPKNERLEVVGRGFGGVVVAMRMIFSPESSYKDRSPESADVPFGICHGSVVLVDGKSFDRVRRPHWNEIFGLDR